MSAGSNGEGGLKAIVGLLCIFVTAFHGGVMGRCWGVDMTHGLVCCAESLSIFLFLIFFLLQRGLVNRAGWDGSMDG